MFFGSYWVITSTGPDVDVVDIPYLEACRKMRAPIHMTGQRIVVKIPYRIEMTITKLQYAATP